MAGATPCSPQRMRLVGFGPPAIGFVGRPVAAPAPRLPPPRRFRGDSFLLTLFALDAMAAVGEVFFTSFFSFFNISAYFFLT